MNIYEQCINNLNIDAKPSILNECLNSNPDLREKLLAFKDYRQTLKYKTIIDTPLKLKCRIEVTCTLKKVLGDDFDPHLVDNCLSLSPTDTIHLIEESCELNKSIPLITNSNLLNDLLKILKDLDATESMLKHEESIQYNCVKILNLCIKHNSLNLITEMKSFLNDTLDTSIFICCINPEIIPKNLRVYALNHILHWRKDTLTTFVHKIQLIKSNLGNLSDDLVAYHLTYQELQDCLELNCHSILIKPAYVVFNMKIPALLDTSTYTKVLALKFIPLIILTSKQSLYSRRYLQQKMLHLNKYYSNYWNVKSVMRISNDIKMNNFVELHNFYPLIYKLKSMNLLDVTLINFIIHELSTVMLFNHSNRMDNRNIINNFVATLNLDTLRKIKYLKDLGQHLNIKPNTAYCKVNKELNETLAALHLLSAFNP